MRTTSSPRGRRRTGSILLIVALFVIVVAGVALARQGQGSQTVSRVKAAGLDAVELDLAGSALEEAALQLGQLANDPAHPIYRKLRSGKASGASVDLAVPVLKGAVAADPDLKDFEVSAVTAKVATAAPLSVDPVECHGAWELTTTVRHKPSGVVRRVTAHRGFKEALMTAPRPYDQFSVLVLDGAPLVGPNANQLIDESADALVRLGGPERAATIARIDQLIAGVNKRIAQVPASGGSLTPLDPQEFEQPIRSATVTAPPAISDSVATKYHHFPPEYCVAANTSKDLGQLWLEPRLRAAAARIEEATTALREAQARVDAVAERIEALANRTDIVADQATSVLAQAKQLAQDLRSGLRALADAWQAAAARHSDLLATVWNYQSDWIETGGAVSRYLRSFEYKLYQEEWSKRAFIRFAGADAPARFLEFLHRYETDPSAPPLNAVVTVDNPGAPLALSGRAIHGKLAIFATGDVDLTDVTLKDRGNDLLVVSCDGKLSIAGTVEAALIPHGSFGPQADVRIDGPVILQQVSAPEKLAGHVTAVDRYFVGVPGSERLDRSYVSLAPWSAVQSIERK